MNEPRHFTSHHDCDSLVHNAYTVTIKHPTNFSILLSKDINSMLDFREFIYAFKKLLISQDLNSRGKNIKIFCCREYAEMHEGNVRHRNREISLYIESGWKSPHKRFNSTIYDYFRV